MKIKYSSKKLDSNYKEWKAGDRVILVQRGKTSCEASDQTINMTLGNTYILEEGYWEVSKMPRISVQGKGHHPSHFKRIT